MPIPLTINGATFEYPEDFDENWGVNATGWAQAVTNGMLQMAGGSFPLTANVNFGPSFGLLSQYFETRASNPSTLGTLRLASADAGIGWRNNANSGNLILTTNSSDQLLYNGSPLATVGGVVTSIIGTANQVIASSPTGNVTLSLPQSIATTSTPTFTALTLTGPTSLVVGTQSTNTGSVSLYNSTNTNYVQVAPGITSSSYTITLPVNSGSNGQVLQTNGAGVTSWVNAAGGGTINSGTANNLAYYATTGSTLSETVSIAAVSSGSGDALRITGVSQPNARLDLLNSGGLTYSISNATAGNVFSIVDQGNSNIPFAYNKNAGTIDIGAGPVVFNTVVHTPLFMGSNQIVNTAAGTASGNVITYRQNGQAVNGSTANSGGSAGTIQQGTISTPDLRPQAVTLYDMVNSTAAGIVTATTIATKAITTIGGNVLITASGAIDYATGAGTMDAVQSVVIKQDGTNLNGGEQTFSYYNHAGGISPTFRAPFSVSVMVAPSPGLHTYTLEYGATGSGFSGTSVTQYSLAVIEFRA